MRLFSLHTQVCIVMELMIGGSLTDVLGPKIDFKEAHIAYVAKATLQALAYMHQSFRMHRDIKSDNVLVRHYRKDNTAVQYMK